MRHLSSDKYPTDYKDKDSEEVNQPTPSPEHEEYPLPVEEPVEDDREPTNKEDEASTEEVDNITKTILAVFAPMPHYKKHRLNPPPPI